MNSKRVVAMLLALVLTVGTITPVFARESARASTGVFYHVVMPLGAELSDEELAEVQGEWANWAGGAIVGAVVFAVTNWDEEKDLDWWLRAGVATASGALTYGIGGALGGAATSQAGKLAADIFTAGTQLIVEWGLGHDID